MSASAMREGLRTLREAGDTTTFEGMDPDDLPPFAVDDEDLDAMIDGAEFFDAKMDAMRAHASQIAVDGPFFAFSNNIGQRVWGHEFYRLVKGTRGTARGRRVRGRPVRRTVIARARPGAARGLRRADRRGRAPAQRRAAGRRLAVGPGAGAVRDGGRGLAAGRVVRVGGDLVRARLGAGAARAVAVADRQLPGGRRLARVGVLAARCMGSLGRRRASSDTPRLER